VAVINALGYSGFDRVHVRNPFRLLPGVIERIRQKTSTIIVDFHAQTTAEKGTMHHLLDGTVSAILGTHTRVLTADERILPGGTAVLTDAGRTGSLNSVGGLEPEIEIRKFITQVPARSKPSWSNLELQGAMIQVDEEGKAVRIERVKVFCGEEHGEEEKQGSQKSREQPQSTGEEQHKNPAVPG
jgi:calcineurin-like phosphoesterase